MLDVNLFDQLRIGLATPGRDPDVVQRRGQEAGDHQLPHAQAREGRALLREDLRSDQGLGVLLRQVQARPVPRHHLRALRRRGHALQGPPRADGPHRVGGPGRAHLVPARHPFVAGLPPVGHRAQGGTEGQAAREGHLLRGQPRHLGRRGSSPHRPADARGRRARRARGDREGARARAGPPHGGARDRARGPRVRGREGVRAHQPSQGGRQGPRRHPRELRVRARDAHPRVGRVPGPVPAPDPRGRDALARARTTASASTSRAAWAPTPSRA